MGRRKKEIELISGIDTDGYGEKIANIYNLVKRDGALVKRQGTRVLCRFESEELLPLKINGIFPYGNYLVVHAGNSLFKCERDFSKKTEAMLQCELPDKRSRAFALDGFLIIECDGAYIYDGESVMPLNQRSDIYIPKTRVGIRNIKSEDFSSDYEEPNMLTSKRINTLRGAPSTDRVNSFLLDSEVMVGKKATVKLQIKLTGKGEDEELNRESTSYTGVRADGDEGSAIANVKFEISYFRHGNTYRVSEPITNENGEEISIKLSNGEVYTHSTINWSLQIVKRELRLNMELVPPYRDTDNIEVLFDSSDATSIVDVQGMGVISCKGGENVLAMSFGDGKIYYTSSKMGTKYLPSGNFINVGTSSTKIQRLVNLQNGYVGAFTSEGFYKIGMPKENEGVNAYKTGDTMSLASPYFVACLGNEPLALADDGVYAVKNLSGYQDSSVYLEKRSKRIDNLLKGFTKEEREKGHMTALGERLYLFIGDYVILTDRESRGKSSTYGSEQYEWYLLKGISARSSIGVESQLYMGDEQGRIFTFYEGECDIDERELSYDKLEIWGIEGTDRTFMFSPYLSQIQTGDRLKGDFLVKIGEGICTSKKITLKAEDLFTSKGELRVLVDSLISLYAGENKIDECRVTYVNPTTCEIRVDRTVNDGIYQLYERTSKEYEIESFFDTFVLKDEGRYVIAKNLNHASVIKRKEIPTLIEIRGIELDTDKKLKMVDQVLIKPTKNTYGDIKISLETVNGKRESVLKIGKELSLADLDMDTLSLEKEFDKEYTVYTMVLSQNYVNIQIEHSGKGNFGLEKIALAWKGEK